MSTQHTPGPWQVDRYGHVTPANGDGSSIAAVTLWDGAANTPAELAESQANARLIAAAPDLLAVMGATLATLQACLPHLKGNQEAMVKVQILACATAIAKAEGRS